MPVPNRYSSCSWLEVWIPSGTPGCGASASAKQVRVATWAGLSWTGGSTPGGEANWARTRPSEGSGTHLPTVSGGQ